MTKSQPLKSQKNKTPNRNQRVLSKKSGSIATKLSQRFPFLSQQSGLANDIVVDLNSTEVEFGSRYKRGKSARLESLQDMENRLELAALKNKLVQHEKMSAHLNQVLSELPGGLWQLFCQPNTLTQADAIFRLSFLVASESVPQFQLDTDLMQDRLQAITPDDLSKTILRDLIISISDEVTAQDIAERHNLGRQAIYDRQTRIVDRLENLTTGSDFMTMIEHIRATACVRKTTHLEVVMSHPLAQVLQLQPNQFPSIWDLVAIGFWQIAHQETGKNKSFRMKVKEKRHVLVTQQTKAR